MKKKQQLVTNNVITEKKDIEMKTKQPLRRQPVQVLTTHCIKCQQTFCIRVWTNTVITPLPQMYAAEEMISTLFQTSQAHTQLRLTVGTMRHYVVSHSSLHSSWMQLETLVVLKICSLIPLFTEMMGAQVICVLCV